VWIPFGLLFLCILAVALFTIDPLETARELTRFRQWHPRAQKAFAAALILPSIALFGLFIRRVQLVRPGASAWSPPPRRKLGDRVSLGVFLGSGGHTAEMRALLKGVDRKRYSPRVYVYCHGDEMSLRAVAELEGGEQPKDQQKGRRSGYSLVALPRARKVGEGYISSLFSATKTALHALFHTFFLPLADAPLNPWVDVLLVNGPGTAVVLVAVAYIRRVRRPQDLADSRSSASPTRASSTSSRLRASAPSPSRARSCATLSTLLSCSGRMPPGTSSCPSTRMWSRHPRASVTSRRRRRLSAHSKRRRAGLSTAAGWCKAHAFMDSNYLHTTSFYHAHIMLMYRLYAHCTARPNGGGG
jgi:hypothetical protein